MDRRTTNKGARFEVRCSTSELRDWQRTSHHLRQTVAESVRQAMKELCASVASKERLRRMAMAKRSTPPNGKSPSSPRVR